ncbi:MAG: sulfatase-like hydrolase/transferase [Planctomycetota bacterium]|nr:sulfatase-like hydrolase/transferase [Planctomycetota bacterium]MDA1160868.1 sulfatase-like hydrolase/transferase [Planctomycetota bacterium]
MNDRPHVLLITTDHWPANLLGCAGHPVIQTPTLDALARCGRRFTNAYSECPVCIPARRSLLTGQSPRLHGDRTFQTTLTMPPVPTIAEAFRNAGYQANAVGKLHVFPQRARAGFDDVILAEEGRPHWGVWDDYDIFLGDKGYAGRQFDHAMSNNQYTARPWHLPEDCHVTTWTAQQMSRTIRRRDPTRPGFWYMSFTHPHPPLVPPQHYWDMYSDVDLDELVYGNWVPDSWRDNVPSDSSIGNSKTEQPTSSSNELCYRLNVQRNGWHVRSPQTIRTALQGFYALCTHIDHQIRLVLGTLREEGILDNTIIVFTADHGDMLGRHGLWAKRLFYEGSANVPFLLVPQKGDERVAENSCDDRLVNLRDVMPTLLDQAGIPIPDSCDGIPIAGAIRRDHAYGECNEGPMAARMIHDGRFKLVYYPAGNCRQLFDLHDDPTELHDLSSDSNHSVALERLTALLSSELYGSDLDWVNDFGELVGLPDQDCPPLSNRGLALQRGVHWPPAPVTRPDIGETNPGTN